MRTAREPYPFARGMRFDTQSARTRANNAGIVTHKREAGVNPTRVGVGARETRPGGSGSRLQEQRETGDRLRVLQLGEPVRNRCERPPEDLDLLVIFGSCGPAFDVDREEYVHALPAEARRRVERAELAPRAAREPDLFLELAPCVRERLLPVLERPGRQLDERPPRRLAQLTDERDEALAVDGDDGGRPGMLDDLARTPAPLLDGHVELLPVVDRPAVLWTGHRTRLSTRRRSSLPKNGGSPARAFAPACSGLRVAGMTMSTRGSESAHFSSASGHDVTPSSASADAGGDRRTSDPSPSGRMTITVTPSSSARGSTSRSHARSCGLSGTCTASKRRERSAVASSPNALLE